MIISNTLSRAEVALNLVYARDEAVDGGMGGEGLGQDEVGYFSWRHFLHL